MEDKDADEDRPEGADACPDGVGGAEGQRLCGFHQQEHTEECEYEESAYPCPPEHAFDFLCPAETVGKSYFAEPGHCENDPVHSLRVVAAS